MCAFEGRSRSLATLRQPTFALKPREIPDDNRMRRHLVITFEFDFFGKLGLGNARTLGAKFSSLNFDETLPRAGGLSPPACSTRLPGSGGSGASRGPRDS
jgi:hypothetical protein